MSGLRRRDGHPPQAALHRRAGAHRLPRLTASRIVVVAGLIRGRARTPEAERFLVSRRPAGTHLADWWEFPGGKIELGEPPEHALARELREELGIDVEVGDVYAVGHHVYETREVLLLVYSCAVVSGQPQCLEVAEFRWVTPAELVALPLPPADEPVVARLRRELFE